MTVKRIQTLANDAVVQQFPIYVSDSYLKRNVGNTGWEFVSVNTFNVNQATVVVGSNGQTAFTLPSSPFSNISVQMFLNGQKMTYGAEYTVSGTAVTYIPGPTTLTTDIVEFYYITGALGGGGGGTVVVSPSSIGSNQNDYNPTSFDSATILRLTSSASYNITGFNAAPAALQKKIINVGSNNITITNQDVLSIAANRIIIPGGSNITMLGDDSVDLFYDVASSRWRVV